MVKYQQKKDSDHICLSLILIDPVLKIDENYYF